MPATPSATWSNSLFGCPDPRDYQVTHNPMQIVRKPIEGSGRYRRVMEEGFYSVSLNVQQTPEQYVAFREFYFNDLNAGQLWFNMPLLIGPTIETLICHIVDGFRQSRNATVYGTYITSFQVEAVRIASTQYEPAEAVVKDSTTPANASLGTLDVKDGTTPSNPSLGTLDVSDPSALLGGFFV